MCGVCCFVRAIGAVIGLTFCGWPVAVVLPGADVALRGEALAVFGWIVGIALRGMVSATRGCVFPPSVESNEMALWKSVFLVVLSSPASVGLSSAACCILAAGVLCA